MEFTNKMSIYTLKNRTAIIVYIILLWSMGIGILNLALPLYVTSIGRSARQWGGLAAVFGFAMIFAEPTWGWISDRIGIPNPLLISRFVCTLLSPVFILTGSMGGLLAAQLGRGAFEVAAGPIGRKALAYSLGLGTKAMGIGLFQACLTIGNAIGPLVGGYVIDRWGYPPVFILCSVLSFTSLLIIAGNRAKLSTLQNPDLAVADVVEAKTPSRLGAAHNHDNRGFYLSFSVLAAVAICLFIGIGSGRAFVAVLGTSVLGLQASQVALVLTVTGTVGAVSALVLGRVSDRVGRKPLIVGGLLILSISLLGYGYTDGIVSMAIFSLLFSLGMAAAMPTVVARVSDITPFARQGQMIGLYGSFEDVGVMLGPLICGFLWDASGPRVAFVVCSLITAVGIAATMFVQEKK